MKRLIYILLLLPSVLLAQTSVIGVDADRSGINLIGNDDVKAIYDRCKTFIRDDFRARGIDPDTDIPDAEEASLLAECVATGKAVKNSNKNQKAQLEGVSTNREVKDLRDLASSQIKECSIENGKPNCKKNSKSPRKGAMFNLNKAEGNIFYSKETKLLGDFFTKRLEEQLYGKEFTEQERQLKAGQSVSINDRKRSKVVDHDMFLKLYETQLGRSTISAITTYCLNADLEFDSSFGAKSDFFGLIKGELDGPIAKANRERNLKNLNTFNFDPNTNKITGESAIAFNRCLLSIPRACKFNKRIAKGSNTKVEPKKGVDIDLKDSDYQKAKDKACAVFVKIKNLRNAISETERMSKLNEEIAKTANKGDSFDAGLGGEQFVPKGKGSAAELTVLTSGDVDAAKIEDSTKEQITEINTACQDPTSQACLDQVEAVAPADIQKVLDEYNTRTGIGIAIIEKIGEKKDDATLIEVLRSGGLTQKEAEAKAADLKSKNTDSKTGAVNFVAIKDDLKEEYVNTRQGRYEEIVSEINSNVINDPKRSPAEQAKGVQRVKNNLSNKALELKKAIRYRNIVGSFLSVDSQDGSTPSGQNTGDLLKEVENSGTFSDSKTGYNENDAEFLKKKVAREGIQADNRDGETLKLQLEQLDEFIDGTIGEDKKTGTAGGVKDPGTATVQ